MHVCGQTLVLVDNDMSVTGINQKLIKTTLKYMFYHRPEDRAFSLNTYEHDITGTEEFTGEVNDLVCAADTMEFEEKDSNLYDTLTEVITRWKDSDFACRDILVFTDGLEGEMLNHEKEELNYLLENGGYPVYVVFLNQENNADAKKGLLSVAVPSGGRLFETEFPGSEAGIDRILCEQIYSAMDGYALANWKQYEEDANLSETEDAQGKAANTSEVENPSEEADLKEAAKTSGEYMSEPSDGEDAKASYDEHTEDSGYMTDTVPEERVVYEYTGPESTEGVTVLVTAAAIIFAGLIAAVLASFVIMKKRRAGKRVSKPAPADDEEYFEDYELKGMGTVDLGGISENDTVFLHEAGDEQGAATRLLVDTHFVNLTDKSNRSRIFRIMLGAPMIIGRGKCDVVISGDDALSKRHCEVFERDGKAYVRDLSSANGTKINDVRIQEDMLSDGDELTIGSRTYMVRLV